MSAYAMDAGECVAAAVMTLRLAAKRGDNWQTIFASIPQHFTARLGSAVDDAWIYALNRQGAAPCPDCRAVRGEDCHIDCSSRWTDGEDEGR